MEGPNNEEAEASIPNNILLSGNNTTHALRRKVAKRTEPWYLALQQQQQPQNIAAPPPPPQDEDIPVTKKPRPDPIIKITAAVNHNAVYIGLCCDSDDEKPKAIDTIVDNYTRSSLLGKKRKRTPIATSTAEASAKTASPDVAMALPNDDDVDDDVDGNDDDEDANTDFVTDTQLNPRATRATRLYYWTADEDAKLTSAVTNNSKMKVGNGYRRDWVVIAMLVPGRTKSQCSNRWNYLFMNAVGVRSGPWTEDEENKLRHSVQLYGGNDWAAIAALVPGRTRIQCWNRWHRFLKPSILKLSIDQATARLGPWTEDEDNKLKDAVQMHGGKDWVAIAALVPGRTAIQCTKRLHAMTVGRAPQWREDEDNKLKDAVQMHGDKDWAAIAALVPGRTAIQCWNRWYRFLKPSIAFTRTMTVGRAPQWREDEDNKLKDGVQMHGDKDWAAIAALVPGRTEDQCSNRWHGHLKPSTDGATARSGKWTSDEDNKLKDAVQLHGCNYWDVIAALVPGRTRTQCSSRWHKCLKRSIPKL
jgi:hypothetical protein